MQGLHRDHNLRSRCSAGHYHDELAMAPSTRQTRREQPLLRHFRAAKPSAPVIKGEVLEGNGKQSRASGNVLGQQQQQQQLDKGKAKVISDNATSSQSPVPSAPVRPSTPPPRNASASNITTPHSPPRTPAPRTRTATLPEYDLLEPEHRSPISVRTDPDSGKMYLLLSSPSTANAHTRLQKQMASDDESTPRHKRIKREGVIDSDEDDELTIIETPKAIRERATSGLLSSATSTPSKPTQFALARGTPTRPDLQQRAKQLKRQRRSTSPEMDEQNNPFLATELQTAAARSASLCIQPIDHNIASSIVRGSRTLPLPTHHATLYALHAALEHALVVYLATVGTAGSAIEEMVENVKKGSEGVISSRSVLAIPELITMSALRPLVERSSGRRFGKQELARLLWIWDMHSNDGNGSRARRSDVGLTVTRTRTLDKSGKRVQDYALGIRLYTDAGDEDDSEEESQAVYDNSTPTGRSVVRPRTPPRASAQRRALTMGGEPMSPSPSPRITRTPGRTPPGSPSAQRTVRAAITQQHTASPLTLSSPSPSLLYSRRGISLVALWNNGLEQRKRVVRQRLLRWCLDCFAAWKQERDDDAKASLPSASQPIHSYPPSAMHKGLGIVHDDLLLNDDADADAFARTPCHDRFPDGLEHGQGGLPTPSATREDGHVPGSKRFTDHFAISADILPAGSSESSYVLEWDADFPLERVAPIPMASLPLLEEPVNPSHTSSLSAASSAMTPQVSRLEAARQAHRDAIAQSEETLGRKLTLAERIRAKEEAAAAKKQGSGANAGGDEGHHILPAALTSAQAVATAARKRSSLSRLQGVAESIYMLFVTSSSGGSVGSGAALRFTPLPVHDVLKAICNASRTAMSAVDAQGCLDQLQTVAPGFVEVDSVGARRWVRLIGRVDEREYDDTAVPAATPASSSSMLAAVRRCVRAELQRLEASEA